MRLNGEDGELLDGPEQALDTIILEDEVFPFTGEGMTASGIQVILEAKMFGFCVCFLCRVLICVDSCNITKAIDEEPRKC